MQADVICQQIRIHQINRATGCAGFQFDATIIASRDEVSEEGPGDIALIL